MSDSIDVGIVLVGLNARDYICQCLRSIGQADWRGFTYEVIYVDNGSTDDSVDAVRSEFPSVRIVEQGRNVGYSPAANEGAQLTDARYLLFINDDTLILDDAIPLLVEYLDQHPTVGVLGSRLLYPDMSEQYSARMYPSMIHAFFGRRSPLSRLFGKSSIVTDYLYKQQLQGTEPFPCDWVSAAGVMIRPDCFEASGRFPEDYYYWHETLFSFRAAKLGWQTFLHPESKIIHYEGKGSGPRPLASQKFHITNFHNGAYRLHKELHGVGDAHPTSWVVFLGCKVRMYLLLAKAYFAHLRQPSHPMKSIEGTKASVAKIS